MSECRYCTNEASHIIGGQPLCLQHMRLPLRISATEFRTNPSKYAQEEHVEVVRDGTDEVYMVMSKQSKKIVCDCEDAEAYRRLKTELAEMMK